MFQFTLPLLLLPVGAGEAATTALHLADLDDDGKLDRIELGSDGSVEVALNRGRRQFEPVLQTLPSVVVTDVLAADLTGDGYTDLYLVSPAGNVALTGDGTGRFVEGTRELGLDDAGAGRSAELIDIDADGQNDLLLHNAHGDVIFWGDGNGVFERDPSSPEATPRVAVGPELAGTGIVVGLSPADPRRGEERSLPDRARTGSAGSAGASPVEREDPGREPMVAPPGTVSADPILSCARTIRDQTGGACLQADSTPTLGRLYPLGPEFSIAPSGDVGIGTTAPESGLHVANDLDSELRVSPNTTDLNVGRADIFLSEGLGLNCGWRLSYDGTNSDNALKFVSECTTPTTRVAIARSTGTLLVGGDDFAPSNAGPGLLRVQGDTSQSRTANGMLKAAVHVDGTGVATITRSFNNLPGGSTPTVTDLGTGSWSIEFGADVSDRFYLATVGASIPDNVPDGTIEATPRSGNASAIFVQCRGNSGAAQDTEFYLMVF